MFHGVTPRPCPSARLALDAREFQPAKAAGSGQAPMPGDLEQCIPAALWWLSWKPAGIGPEGEKYVPVGPVYRSDRARGRRSTTSSTPAFFAGTSDGLLCL